MHVPRLAKSGWAQPGRIGANYAGVRGLLAQGDSVITPYLVEPHPCPTEGTDYHAMLATHRRHGPDNLPFWICC